MQSPERCMQITDQFNEEKQAKPKRDITKTMGRCFTLNDKTFSVHQFFSFQKKISRSKGQIIKYIPVFWKMIER
jgi:hypothetical protein